jgi:hypothetical protein
MMLSNGEVTPELDVELARLNQAVDDAVAARKAWMDAHMADYARFQVGEVVYDMRTGQLLGSISSLYRYHADDSRFDRSMSIDYQIQEPGWDNCYTNTSSLHCHVGTAEQLAESLEWDARAARERADKSRGARL